MSQDLEKLKCSVDQAITEAVMKILERINSVETAQAEKNRQLEESIATLWLKEDSSTGKEPTVASESVKEQDPVTTIVSANLRWEYEVLRDSVSKVMLHDHKVGIAQKDREQAAVIGRSGKFVETCLKLMGEIQKIKADGGNFSTHLDNVVLALTAHMRFLQEEHASLSVGGQYGPQTKSIFRSLQRNTSNLNAEGIENLKTAVAISQPQQTSNQGPPQRGGGFRPGFRFRGGFRGRGRGYQAQQGYQGYQGYQGTGYQQRQFPPARENIEQE